MISKAKLQFIRSLESKKGRNVKGSFVAETPKVVDELINAFEPELIVATTDWLEINKNKLLSTCHSLSAEKMIEVSPEELRKISFLQHPQKVLAVFKQRPSSPNDYFFEQITDTHDSSNFQPEQLILALDEVQDPGNMGTIIRIADWFGIENLICSENTADVYNPKVVQATMGSLARVHVTYTNLSSFIDLLPVSTPVYGTFLDGEDIYKSELSESGIIVMGNEGNGISPEIRNKINKRLLIPCFPSDRETVESLNVAVATAITCSEFRRKKYQRS